MSWNLYFRKALQISLAALVVAVTSGCARLTLDWASLNLADQPPASPSLAVVTKEMWEEKEAPALREAFQEEIYGRLPEESSVEILSRTVVDDASFSDLGRHEEILLQATAEFDSISVKTNVFGMDLVFPLDAEGPFPVILMQTFCPRTESLPRPAVTSGGFGVSCAGGLMSGFMKIALGRYVVTPPVETILQAGYAIAAVYPSEAVPDDSEEGRRALEALAPTRIDASDRWGAIAAWGWLYSRMIDALEEDERIDPEAFIVFGHSRYGKAALFAGAFDERIAAVVSNQSGAGGAALHRDKKGESVKQITKAFPHWFAPAYVEYAGREEELPVDQHQLLALIAPRPVFLGNARRDVWADPNGTFRAALGANPVYRLYGGEGLAQEGMRAFDPYQDITYWLRGGVHGLDDDDWPALLEFLDVRFGQAAHD